MKKILTQILKVNKIQLRIIKLNKNLQFKFVKFLKE